MSGNAVRGIFAVILVLIVSAQIYAGNEKNDTALKKGDDFTQADATEPAATAAPSVRTITLPELQRMIRDRYGEQLVLNMWATWCVPCTEEFPDLVKLEEKTGDTTDIAAISGIRNREARNLTKPSIRELIPLRSINDGYGNRTHA